LEDDHVAAIAPALFEEAARGRPRLLRRDDFEEGVADHEDFVFEAVLADAGVVVALVQAQHGADPGDSGA
jgi:hypothetical protein